MIRFECKPEDLCITVEASEQLDSRNGDFASSDCGEEDFGTINGFDETLRQAWEAAQKKGYFNYPLTAEMPCKILPGKFSYIAQLNPERALKRRKPQEMQCPNQPFNPNVFNFNKVNPREIIMSLEFKAAEQESNQGAESSNFILINVSPLEYGHVLIVPNMHGNEPQRVTLDGLQLALRVLLLNKSGDFRVGLNSLCGYASVNHHHYHAYYLKHRLFLEHAELNTLAGPCHVVSDQDFPAQGFTFILQDSSPGGIKTFLSDSMRLVSILQEMNLAHNIFMTRASTRNQIGHFDSIRIYIWARRSSFGDPSLFTPSPSDQTCSGILLTQEIISHFVGAKECDGFNPALCELSGHFPMKNESSYASISEVKIYDELRLVCQETFEKIRTKIIPLYQ